jgi:two-component system, NtrC family, sensor kinase
LEEPLRALASATDDSALAKRIMFALDEMPRLTDGIRNGVTRISSIVKGLKTYAHQGSPERSMCDLNECIHMAVDLCYNTLKHALDVMLDLDDNPCLVLGNAQQLEQVLVNLFTNAADALLWRARFLGHGFAEGSGAFLKA